MIGQCCEHSQYSEIVRRYTEGILYALNMQESQSFLLPKQP